MEFTRKVEDKTREETAKTAEGERHDKENTEKPHSARVARQHERKRKRKEAATRREAKTQGVSEKKKEEKKREERRDSKMARNRKNNFRPATSCNFVHVVNCGYPSVVLCIFRFSTVVSS